MIDSKNKLKIIGFGAIFLVIAGYAIYQSKNLIEGPVLNVLSPYDGQTFEKSLIDVRGKVKNISFITLDGKQIFTDEDGNFEEKLLLLPGTNIIEIDTKDKFDNVKKEVLRVVYLEK